MSFHNNSTGNQYESALAQCEQIAKEEYEVSNEVISGINRTVTALLGELGRVGTPGSEIGTVGDTAKEKIDAIRTELNHYGTEKIQSARHSLKKKAEHLSKFTVTLFGRTMAGKSTIREAITRGDGKTIGQGSQRTTRDIQEYEWNHLRILDTPGIGAYEGEADREIARSVVDESDVLLFLVNSQGIQETSVNSMKAVRRDSKPIIFVLNVLLNLEHDVNMRRFLRDPGKFLGSQAVRGHIDRIEQLARKELSLPPDIKIVPIHAQAAFLATRNENAHVAKELHDASRIDSLVEALTEEVMRFGGVRRIQTILDGTTNHLCDFAELLIGQSKTLEESSQYLKGKFKELDGRFTRYIDDVGKLIQREAEAVFDPLRNSVASFLEDNLQKRDVQGRWVEHVNNIGIESWMKSLTGRLYDEVRALLKEFHREIDVESDLNHKFGASGPAQYNPWDVRRTLRWISTGTTVIGSAAFLLGGGALLGVKAISSLIAASNFWNPVGWIAMGVSAFALVSSWLFKDKDKKIQNQRADAAKQLREQIDHMESQSVTQVRKWFNENIADKLIRGIRVDTRDLCAVMHTIADLLQRDAMVVNRSIEEQYRRLIFKIAALIDTEPIQERHIGKLVRDPGIKTKFLWEKGEVTHESVQSPGSVMSSAASKSTSNKQRNKFCRDVGTALDEYVIGVSPGTPEETVARALFPARITPEMVFIESKQHARVTVPQSQIGRTIGKNGHNVILAGRLLDFHIHIQEESTKDEQKMKKAVFEFSGLYKRMAQLKDRLHEQLSQSADENVRRMLERIPSIECHGRDGDSSPPLTVAFVGQYDAGKSTIISALTNRRDIKIDDNICTDKVTAYDWNGIKILDTPGIHAGYPDHDAKTYSAIDKADLLVFVITSGLFDDIIGNHFREICFTRNKASETMLVVNRMTDYPGTPEIKLPDIQQVTTPKMPDDFYVTFIDALSYLEASEENDEDNRKEMLEIANFQSFIEALNRFVQDNRLMGRLTSPLFQIRALAQQAAALIDVDTPEEKAAIELLTRKRSVLFSSRARLKGVIDGLIRKTASGVIALGHEVAEAVVPGSTEENIKNKHESAQREADGLFESLQQDIESEIIAEETELRQQVENIEKSPLNQKLQNLTSGLTDTDQRKNRGNESPKMPPGGVNLERDRLQGFASAAHIAENIGKFAPGKIAQFTSGPMAQTAKIGSAAAARGSQAHKTVLTVGKFFNVKFKPWGAVKIASGLGKLGRVISVAGPILAVAGQMVEDIQKKKNEAELRENRDKIRQAYQQYAYDVESKFQEEFEVLNEHFYEEQFSEIEQYIASFIKESSDRNEASKELSSIASLATREIEAVQLNKN